MATNSILAKRAFQHREEENDGSDDDDDVEVDSNVFDVYDATVHEIKLVNNNMLRALCSVYYKEHYPSQNITQPTMTTIEAKVAWNQDPRLIQRRQHGSDANAEADVVATTAAENVGETEQFGQMSDERDEMPDIEAMLNYAAMGDNNTDPQAEDNYKRHKLASTIKATVIVKYDDGKKTARVTGSWPVLSSSIMLHIRGTIERRTNANDISVVVAGKSSCIELAPIETISGRQFYNIVREAGSYELPVIRKYVALLFNEKQEGVIQTTNSDIQPSAVAARGRPVIYNSIYHARAAQQDLRDQATARVDNNAVYVEAAKTHLTVTELRRRIRQLDDTSLQKMLFRCPFVSMGPAMILRAPELSFIAAVYDDVDKNVWREALARGEKFIDELYRLLTTDTHTLCFSRLRKQVGRTCGVPALGLLPDISIEQYEKLVKTFDTTPDPVVVTAVTMYNKILLEDVHGEKKMRRMENDFSINVPKTSGHMFTVFADHQDNQEASYFHTDDHTETDKRLLCDLNPMSFAGRFCLLARGSDGYTREMRIWLGVDRARIGRLCTHDDFINALYWLIDRQLIVVHRFTGTGKHNRGMPVDAFYLAEIYETQKNFIASLADIYERGVAQSFYNQQAGLAVDDLAPARLVALHRVQTRRRELYNSMYTNAVKMIGKFNPPKKEVDAPAVAAEGNDDDDGDAVEASKGSDDMAEDDGPPPIAPIIELAQLIANDDEEWRAHYATYLQEGGCLVMDAYADVKGLAPHRSLPALLVAKLSRVTRSGKQLGPEQIEALERVLWSSVVQICGRGGVGKSEIIALILDMFPPDQVLIVAPTGNVASDLTQRTGHKAHTLHSVLTKHSQFLEAHNRAQAFRKRSRQFAKRGVRMAEEFTYEDVMHCTDEREARAYVDHMTGSYNPFVSPYAGKRVFIVDEASLAALSILRNSIESFHSPRAGRAVYKFISVGDLDQLLPLGWGSPQSDMAHGLPMTVCELVINRRSLGTKLFDVAQAMAEHRFEIPNLVFGDGKKEFHSIKDGDDLVAVRCTPSELCTTIQKVAAELRIINDHEKRRNVQFISTTNYTAQTANGELRMQFFGENQLQDFLDHLQENHQRAPDEPPPNMEEAKKKERDAIARRLAMRVYVDDRIYLTKNSKIVFQPLSDNDEKREVHFNNSRRLRALQFYDAPSRLLSSMCRCHRCPDKPEDASRGYRYPCMERLDQVPIGRRERDLRILWHDQGLRDGKRRMGVFVDDDGNFVEMDVLRMLTPRSRYGNGFCLTTHRLQGSQADVVVYICVDDKWYINWKFLYTALTRGKQRVIILSTQHVFNRLVRRRAPMRRSMLWYILQETATRVLERYPQSIAAKHARDKYPKLFVPSVVSDDRWCILEDARYRTDRNEAPAATTTNDDN